MSYQVLTSTKVEKQLSKLNSVTVQAILEKIKSLARTPRPRGYKKLKGRVGYRIRMGSYRIIYDVLEDKTIVLVLQVRHRKNAYK